ncbi:TonB-dependent receptor [Sphingomonas sp. ID0503]|uniref:TonB-dependent receptor n=1 Tax=Sphingomonas sp. ID0503 TaxID=3399691 RepID=UPI003AFB4FAF
MRKSWILLAVMGGASTSALAQSVADPATDTQGLQDIIVTATRRSENLQNVPVAVTAVSAADLTKRGVFETSDLNNSMPNLQVSSPYGKQQPNFSLRGIGVGTEFNANAASPVGIYVDEVYQAFRSSHGQQLYDLNQIEVVRGPQGTLYGRNTTGGAINFITKQPQLSGSEGYLTLGYGNFDRRSAEGAVEYTPVDDMFGIRVAGTFVDTDPYIRNVLPAGPSTIVGGGASGLNFNTGRSPGGWKNWGARVSMRFKPTEDIDLNLKLYAGRATGTSDANIPFGSSRTSDVIDWTNPNFLLSGIFQALAPAGIVPASYSADARGLKEREIETDSQRFASSRAKGAVFNARIQLSDTLKLISISGYDDGRYVNNQDCDATPLRLCAIGYDSKFNAFNQDIRLDYDGDRTKLIVGGFYGRDSLTANNHPDFFNFLRDVNAAVGSPTGYFNPGGAFNGAGLSAGSLPTGITAEQTYKQVRKSYAIYGEGSYEITDTLKLTAGLRYTMDRLRYKDGITTYFDDTGVARMITVSDFMRGGAFAPYFLQPVLNEAGAVVIPSDQAAGTPLPGGLSNKGRSNEFSGRVIVDWKPTERSLIYGSYSRGYRAGTFNGLAYGTSNQVYFVPPEKVDAYEIGLKSRWFDNRLQLNAAFFYYDYQGQQGQVIDATATGNLVSLDGKIKGLEIEAQLAATDRLRLSASFGLLDSKYADDPCPTTPITGFPAQAGSCVVSAKGPVNVGGNPFPYAPKTSINLGADWTAVRFSRGELLVHADASYTGQFYYDAFKDYSRGPLPQVSTGRFSQGEGKYWVVNSRVTYSLDRFSVSAWVKNLTDKTYYPFAIALENLFGNGHLVRAEPRTYGVEATVKF